MRLGVGISFDEHDKPHLIFEKEEFSMSEAASYFEFTLDVAMRVQRGGRLAALRTHDRNRRAQQPPWRDWTAAAPRDLRPRSGSPACVLHFQTPHA